MLRTKNRIIKFFPLQGVRDDTAFVACGAAFDFYDEVGGQEALKEYISPMMDQAVELFCDALNVKPHKVPKTMRSPFMRVIGMKIKFMMDFPPNLLNNCIQFQRLQIGSSIPGIKRSWMIWPCPSWRTTNCPSVSRCSMARSGSGSVATSTTPLRILSKPRIFCWNTKMIRLKKSCWYASKNPKFQLEIPSQLNAL